MSDSIDVVRQFGLRTQQKNNEVAKRLGVAIDQKFLSRTLYVAQVMAAIVDEDAGMVVDINQHVCNAVEGCNHDELAVYFCINTCQAGFMYLDCGNTGFALEMFGLVRSLHGYMLRKDYKEALTPGVLAELVRKIRSENAANAVANRDDQILKPQWQKHVRQCWERGVTIRNIDDLLNQPLANPKISKITPTTLKQWAKEEVPELSFKAGRPKKNTPHHDK